MIRQITIVGTGLIGGSFGLALRQHGFRGSIIGCDQPEVIEAALARGAIDRGGTDVVQESRDSDVLFLATPVGVILSLLPKIASGVTADTLVTDAGSTKVQIAERASMAFGDKYAERFLPGHPMAGKELGGIGHADPELFRDAAWLITPSSTSDPFTARQQEYLELLKAIGARVIVMEIGQHDRLCAWVSHLPQMMATALASLLREELGDDEAVAQVGGRALREMTRIAHSPYSMWRDIALTNSDNIGETLLRLEQQLGHLRENLRGPALREMFERANQFGKKQ